MGGHVFVVHGDLTRLGCDDVLVPTDGRLNVTTGFGPLLGETSPGDLDWVRPVDAPAIPRDWSSMARDPLLLRNADDGRRIWLVNTADGEPTVEWLLAGVQSAVAHVAREPRPARRPSRARGLVGLPLVGVGAAGFAGHRAEVIRKLLTLLREAVAFDGAPDVALVLFHRSDYDVVQSRRTVEDFPAIRAELASAVDTLAGRARAHELVVFLGAGVSIAAGLPSWGGLIDQLARRSDLTPEQRVDLARLSAPDAAAVIEAALGAGGLQAALREILSGGSPALAHALVASTRIPEVITTNYDRMFEDAARVPAAGSLLVLPGDPSKADRPWLLKLHGDLEDPRNPVVLTREDYLRFDSDRAPLASMVQSRLFTRHMLFVGYSLADDNFVRLARQVHTLMRRSGDSAPVGTVLSLLPEPAKALLWKSDLDYFPVMQAEPADGTGADVSLHAARELEIVLDRLAWRASHGGSFLLDDRYAELLKEPERALREALMPLVEAPGTAAADSRYWPAVEQLLAELGYRRD